MYDAAANVAYWIHIQTFLQENPGLDPNQASHTVYIDKQNRLNELAMRQFAIAKQAVIESNQGGLKHDA